MKGGLGGLIVQARQMRQRMEELRAELESREVRAEAGEGAVRVVATCGQRLKSLKIEPGACEERELLEDLLVTAINRALEEGRRIGDEEMKRLTGGVDLPAGLL